MPLDRQDYLRFIPLLGVFAIIVSIVTWTLDLTGLVYECPYCRVQRTVIGILGVFMLIPGRMNWLLLYLVSIIGAYGAINAIQMNFNYATAALMVGKFTKEAEFHPDVLVLSGAALFIIAGEIWLLFLKNGPSDRIVAEPS